MTSQAEERVPNFDDPEKVREALADYVLGALGPAERRRVEERAAADPALAAELRSLERTLGALAYAAPAEPPARLRSRVLGAAEGLARRRAPSRGAAVWRPGRLAATAALFLVAVAATISALRLGVENRRLEREIALQREVAETLLQPNVVMTFSIKGKGTSARAAGHVLLDLDDQKGAVVIHHLGEIPSGRVYRLWAEMADQGRVPCGEFAPDERGDVVSQFPIPVNAYTSPIRRLILTDETAAPRPAPTGPTVMESF